jgi:hypothetical protein
MKPHYSKTNRPLLLAGKTPIRSGAGTIILLTGFFALSLSEGSAVTYYVDSIAGAETNDGTTPDTPWQSLTATSKVNTVEFQPGDQVLFKRGSSWSGTFMPKGAGSSTAPLVFDAYGPATDAPPLIVGSGGAAIRLWNKRFVTVQNFELTNPGPSPGTRNGVHLIFSNSGSYPGVKIRNNEIHDVVGYTTRGGGANYSTGAVYIEFPSGTAAVSDLLIEGNYIHDTQCIGIQIKPGSFMAGKPEHWIKRLVVRGNLLETTGGDHILVQGADAPLIEYNAGYDAGVLAAPNADLWIAGMWVCYFTRDSLFQFNEAARTANQFMGGLTGGDSQAFDVDYGTEGKHVFQYNYTHDNAGGALLMMPPTPNPKGGSYPPAAKTIIYRYNISVNDDRTSMSGRQVNLETAPGINSAHIHNNVFFNNRPLGFKVSDTAAEYYTNNIFHAAVASYGSQPRFTHNCYYGHIPVVNDPAKVLADPKFIGPLPVAGTTVPDSFVSTNPGDWTNVTTANNGFKLQPDSPCINAGKVIPTSTGGRDFWNTPLYSGAPDIGAQEVVGGAAKAPEAVVFVDNPNIAPLSYSAPGQWTFHTNKPNYDNSTVTVGNTVNSWVQCDFTGSNVTFVSVRGPDCGIVNISIDGAPPTAVDLYWPAKLYRQEVFQTTGLSPGPHTIRITIAGKNPASLSTSVMVDYFQVLPGSPPAPEATVAADDTTGKFNGTWAATSSDQKSYLKTLHTSGTVGDSFEFTFTGTGVRLYGPRSNARGDLDVTVNGVTTRATSYTPGNWTEQASRLYEINGLPHGSYTLHGVVSIKNPNSNGNEVGIDLIETLTGGPGAPATPGNTSGAGKTVVAPKPIDAEIASSVAADDPVVLTINQEPVSAREYRLVMQRRIAAVHGLFMKVQKQDDHQAYWSAASGPNGPLAKLRGLVLEELIRIKVAQRLAKAGGLTNDTTFQAFHRSFEAENSRRSEAKKAGEILYGPEHYRLSAYYYTRLRDLEYRLKEVMAAELAGKVTDAEIARYYTDHRGAFGKKTLPEMRQRIAGVLSAQRVEAQLERLRSEAKVKIEESILAPITPRSGEPVAGR